MPLVYRGLKLDCGYKLDMVVEGTVSIFRTRQEMESTSRVARSRAGLGP